MDVLTDEHEREQIVRKWWSDNWKSLTVGVVIALGLMIGYRQYQSYTQSKAEQNAYQLYQLQTKISLSTKSDLTDAYAFIKEHEDIYGSLLALDVAAIELTKENYDKGIELANFANKNGGVLIKSNAALVKARILTQKGQYDEAIKIVNAIDGDAYSIEKTELLGDIYLVQNDKDKAHDAYKKAIDLCLSQKISINPLLQIKFDSLIKDGETPAFKQAAELQEEIVANASEIKNK